MTQLAVFEPEQLKELIKEAINPLLIEVKGLLAVVPPVKLSDFSTQSSAKEDLISRKEACKLLQISHVTLAAWSKKGCLPFYRLNRRVYFKKSEILNSMKRIHGV